MNRLRMVVVAISSVILLVSVGIYVLNQTSGLEPFYVGVTYCGESVEEAKLLIDRVKDYTNLFVLQSGSIQHQPDKINEICDYIVDSDLNFILYFGTYSGYNVWYETFDDRWDNHFLGIYLDDEPAGKMLESERSYWDNETQSTLRKTADGRVMRIVENTTFTYWPDGRIVQITREMSGNPINDEGDYDPSLLNIKAIWINYFANGTIITEISDHFGATRKIVEDYNVTHTYGELWNSRPFQTYDETAQIFVGKHQNEMLYQNYGEKNVTAFTSDYVLYWFDYRGGYDVVLAQFGWNHTLAQDIALVRGAAELQNKPWGAIITWKYNHPPYLDSGEAIYDQMRTAYEAGAEYVVVFNYAEDMEDPYGTLQDEHFIALEQFWNDVVQSSAVKHGSVEAEAVLVLPENYGWGMRNPEDTIWGVFEPDEKSQQIWDISRNLLEQYGLALDIVYHDSEFPVEGKYSNIFHWNQTM